MRNQKNIDALSRFYAAFNRGDLEGMIAELHPDFEARPSFGGHMESRVFRGHDGVREWFHDVVPEVWSELTATPERFVEGENATVVLVRNVGKARASGIEIDHQVAHVCSARDGKISRIYAYPDVAEGFRAGGLEPPTY